MFSTIDQLWRNTINHLLLKDDVQQSRVGKTKEIIGFSAKLSDIDRTFLLNTRRRLSPYYACAETLWYLSYSGCVKMISAYAPQYVNFAEDGIAYGAYGKRMWSNLQGQSTQSQLDLVIQHLKQDRDSRQCVLTLWTANDLRQAIDKTHKDLPCTLSMQFLIRDNKLHLVVIMRSNDAWLGLPYDIFAFTTIQHIIAGALSVETGTYTHQVGSMHLYEKNWDAAEEATRSEHYPIKYVRNQHDWESKTRWIVDRNNAVYAEERYRLQYELHQIQNITSEPLRDLVAVCAHKWGHILTIKSSLLKIALQFERKTVC